MAPKKDEKAKAKEEELPVGPSVQELQKQIEILTAEKATEAKGRSRTQIERDKLTTFFEIKNKELEQCRAELRNKDRDMEELEEKHRLHLKVLNQKSRHLLYEQQHLVNSVKGDNEMAIKLQREQASKRELELLDEQRILKNSVKQVEMAHEEAMKQMKLDHAKEITLMRQEFDFKAKDLIQGTEKKMKKLEANADLRRKHEVHEVEERKNGHIITLMKNHEKAFSEIKCYYNDVTQNNLDLIKTLKEDITDMKKKEQANEKFMYEIAQENKQSMEPLTRALKELELLRKQLQLLEKDRQALQQLRVHHAENIKHTKDLEWEYRALQDKLETVQADRDDLYARFETCIFDVQQKCGIKSSLLQKKVQVLGEELEKKEAQLGEAIGSGKLDAGTVNLVKYGIDKILETKNQQIKSLYYELGKVTKAYNSVVKAFECKLCEFGVPLQEMGLPHFISKIKL